MMNGTTSHGNGVASARRGSTSDVVDIQQLEKALEAVHNPRSPNEVRKNATIYLDEAKSQPHASTVGTALARDTSRPPVIRYYGLSVVEFQIKYRWEEEVETSASTFKDAVLQLAYGVTDQDPPYLRNKVAQLIVEVAKRCWLDQWVDLDDALCHLWTKSLVHKLVVLHVLETMSDEIFSGEDTAAGFRGAELGKACVEIFTPAEVLAKVFPTRDTRTTVRHGDEGWLQRLVDTLQSSLQSNAKEHKYAVEVTVKVLSVLRSAMTWLVLDAVVRTNCIELIGECITSSDNTIRMTAVEVFHSLYHRSNFQDEEIVKLVCPILGNRGISFLRGAYESCLVDVEDIDEAKYSTLKKFAEVLCALGSFVEQRPHLIAEHGDVPNFLALLVEILRHQSLVVSVPVLFIWTKLLTLKSSYLLDQLSRHFGTLLETCGDRLIRYESFPADSSDPTFMFLNEDFDTVPERHAFLGNYRRFCQSAIESIVSRTPIDALEHILRQAEALISTISKQPFDINSYNSASMSVLKVDAQVLVVVTAIKAFNRIQNMKRMDDDLDIEADANHRTALGKWTETLLLVEIQDPMIVKQILQLSVEIATTALPRASQLALKICDSVLSTPLVSPTGPTSYVESMKELYSARPRELQKLARPFSDAFFSLYQDLESRVNTAMESNFLEQRVKLDYGAFLFSVILHATMIDDDDRRAHLQRMINNPTSLWNDASLKRSLAHFDPFCSLLALDTFAKYFLSKNANNVENWAELPLDDQGLQLRDRIQNSSDAIPLQSTRSLLSVSTEKTRSRSKAVSQSLWKDAIPIILPQVLQCIGHAHAFNSPSTWSEYPSGMHNIIKRIFMDRVWQSGISNESRDDFFARVRDSKNSLEGLASAIRGAVRGVREISYWIVHCMTQFGDAFYGHSDLPEPLAAALYTHAQLLSSHQFSALLKLSTALIEGCPVDQRSHFLPPLLVPLLQQIDSKIASEWESVEHRKDTSTGEDNLGQEMKDESILRQLTYSAVTLASNLIECSHPHQSRPDFRNLVLWTPTILEPLLVFCTHALRIHDGRSCALTIRVLRHVVATFSHVDESEPLHYASVRNYLCTDLLRAAISSLHEPYFAALQKDLASLIAAILYSFALHNPAPREILLSLPGMGASDGTNSSASASNRVDMYLEDLLSGASGRSERSQRALVLQMLEGVRGVSIHEQGKMFPSISSNGGFGASQSAKEKAGGASRRTLMQEQFGAMTVDSGPGAQDTQGGGQSPDFGGVADLFG